MLFVGANGNHFIPMRCLFYLLTSIHIIVYLGDDSICSALPEGYIMTVEGDIIDILLDDDSEQTVSWEFSSNKLIVEQTILDMGGEAAAMQASQLSEIAKEM